MNAEVGIRVREMRPDEAGIRIGYFHDATDEYLRALGVDRELLPAPEAWRESYELDCARPIHERTTYALLWLAGDQVVGFSTADQISYGEQAFMHLHIIDSQHRSAGLGTQFVRQSAARYFRVLSLKRLYCQPNAFNVAPNRTLQRAGFRYLFTAQMAPGAINVVQPVTRWVLEESPA